MPEIQCTILSFPVETRIDIFREINFIFYKISYKWLRIIVPNEIDYTSFSVLQIFQRFEFQAFERQIQIFLNSNFSFFTSNFDSKIKILWNSIFIC